MSRLSVPQREILDDLSRGGVIKTDGGLGWPKWDVRPIGDKLKSRLFPKCQTLQALEKRGLIDVTYSNEGYFGQCTVIINDSGRKALEQDQ